MKNGNNGWSGFSAFQVFGDHVPMDGFKLVVRISLDPDQVRDVIAERAQSQAPLDPDFARCLLRAGLGLMQTGLVSFVYASGCEVVVVLLPDAVLSVGESLHIHDRIVTQYAASLALLVGKVIPAIGEVYEFPNVGVVRKAVVALQSTLEETTPSRSAHWIGAQMRGRREAFHPSMVETLEEQMAILQANGVDLESLPLWWWRGMAVRRNGPEVEVFDELPDGEELGALIV